MVGFGRFWYVVSGFGSFGIKFVGKFGGNFFEFPDFLGETSPDWNEIGVRVETNFLIQPSPSDSEKIASFDLLKIFDFFRILSGGERGLSGLG